MDLNKVMLIGRATRDPELRSLPSGKAVATFGLATGRAWTDANGQKQKQTEFHNIVAWARTGEIAHQYIRKGKQVYVEGRLQTREWTGQDGQKRNRTEVVVENLILLGSPSGSGPGMAPQPATSAPSSEPSYSATPQEVIEEEIKVEDIPF